MRYKLLVLDLDGTALGSDPSEFAPGVLDAAAEADARGCTVVVATGRTLYTLPPIIAAGQLPWLRYLALYDGAEVLDLPARTCLWRRTIAPGALDAAARVGRQYGVPLEYVDATGCYHVSAGDWEQLKRLPLSSFHRRVLEHNAVPFSGAASALAPKNVLKLNIPSLPADAQEPVCDALRAAGLLPVECAPGALEITSPAAGKLEAVRFLAGRLGLTLADVLALGDSGNDAALLAAAGLGVAMGNAPDFVKSAARAVASPNTEGGAAQAIRRYLLEAPASSG